MTALPSTDRPLTAGDVFHFYESRKIAGLDPVTAVWADGHGVLVDSALSGRRWVNHSPDHDITFVSRPAPVPEAGEGVEPVAWRWKYEDVGLTNWYYGLEAPGNTPPHRSMMAPAVVQPLYLNPAPSDRVAELEAALRGVLPAMEWAQAHIGGHTKYESASQVLNCVSAHDDAVEVVRAALSASHGGASTAYEARLSTVIETLEALTIDPGTDEFDRGARTGRLDTLDMLRALLSAQPNGGGK